MSSGGQQCVYVCVCVQYLPCVHGTFLFSTSLVLPNYPLSYTQCVLHSQFTDKLRLREHVYYSERKVANTRGFEFQLCCCWVNLTCLLTPSPLLYKVRIGTPAL